eukprot:3196786-Alexandrium_andersonii.AAC.1
MWSQAQGQFLASFPILLPPRSFWLTHGDKRFFWKMGWQCSLLRSLLKTCWALSSGGPGGAPRRARSKCHCRR